MGKMIINFSAILLLVLLVSTGLIKKGEAQGQQGCEWECKQLPNFKCWLGEAGHRLCRDMCLNAGAVSGTCVSDSPGKFDRCLCRKAGCS